MPSVTIEQNLESRQTYLRLKGVGYMLNDPKFSIGGDSNEMLGPAGWKNQDIANGALQCLDGDDLLLEMDSRLIAHLEPGRALEVGIPELGFTQRIQPPRLHVFPPSNAPPPPGTKVFEFEGSPARVKSGPEEPRRQINAGQPLNLGQPRAGRENIGHDSEPFGSGDQGQTIDISGRNSGGEGAGGTQHFPSDTDGPEPPDESTDGEGGTRVFDSTDVPDDAGEAPNGDPADERGGSIEPPPLEKGEETPVEPERGRSSRIVVAAALIAGLVVGFFSKYFVDEYGLLPSQVTTSGTANRKLELVKTDAFGPLGEDLRRLPDKSPLGLSPDAVPGIRPPTAQPAVVVYVNPGRIYFNYGAQKAREGNKAEATYWYKRSIMTIEPEAFTFLGDAYLNGDGAPRDVKTGFQLLRLAAGLGSERARSYLSERLQAGAIPNAPTTMGDAFQPGR
jgi:hypothetical protein